MDKDRNIGPQQLMSGFQKPHFGSLDLHKENRRCIEVKIVWIASLVLENDQKWLLSKKVILEESSSTKSLN